MSRAGRPPEYKSRKIITTNVEEELYKEFFKIARREGKSVSELLQEFMTRYVKNHGEGNPVHTLDKFADPDFRPYPTVGEPDKWGPFMEKCNIKEAEEVLNFIKKIGRSIEDRIDTITLPKIKQMKAKDMITEAKKITCRYTHDWEEREGQAICKRCGKVGAKL